MVKEFFKDVLELTTEDLERLAPQPKRVLTANGRK
jgi:hypothetical protein